MENVSKGLKEFKALGIELINSIYDEAKDLARQQIDDPDGGDVMEYVHNFYPYYFIIEEAIERLDNNK